MQKAREPGAGVGEGPLPIHTLPEGSRLWRVQRKDAAPACWPLRDHRPVHRFDAPAGEFCVLYAADSPEVAVAETVIRRSAPRYVPRKRLEERSIAEIVVRHDLRLVRFHGPGLIRLGIGVETVHGSCYRSCQELALRSWGHPDAPDGIVYRSRWDNDGLCYAFFDRVADTLDVAGCMLDLGDPWVYGPILDRYELGLG